LFSGYAIGGNSSAYKEIFSGYAIGNNVSIYKPIFSGYAVGGNTSTYKEIFSGYAIGGNNSTYKTIFSGYAVGGNISTWKELFSGWAEGGNTTPPPTERTWQTLFQGYAVGGNNTTYQEIFSGYAVGGNSSSWNEIFSGWALGGSENRTWTEIYSGYAVGGNVTGYREIFSGYALGGNISVAPLFLNPNPANGSIVNTLIVNWTIDISDNSGSFNYTIESSTGLNKTENNTTNGTKYLDLGILTIGTTYTLWVNATDGIYWTREWFTFTTPLGGVTGDFTYTVEGQTVILKPTIGLAVDEYRWKIKGYNGANAETSWINRTDLSDHICHLTWDQKYIIELHLRNETLQTKIGKIIKIGSMEGSNVRNITTDKDIETPTEKPEIRNMFDVVPDHIKDFFTGLHPVIKIIIIVGSLTLIFIIVQRKKKIILYKKIRSKK
jgi:hypothetical protein